MREMPKDLDQRKRYVKDLRRQKIADEKRRKAEINSWELDEITDNIDRAWSKAGHLHFNPAFYGFGSGGGRAGTYVLRNGKLVPK